LQERQRKKAEANPVALVLNPKFLHERLNGPPLLFDNYTIGSLNTVHYVNEYLTEEDETSILDFVKQANRWVGKISSETRRTQNWGGRPSEASLTEELPIIFQKLIASMVHNGIYPPDRAPNHVLVNEYRDGCGIIPHVDAPLYWPIVATITLGGAALLNFTSATEETISHDVYLPRRCLMRTSGEVYTEWLHGIQKSTQDVITKNCMNLGQIGLAIGDVVPRSNFRVSLVFVHKIQEKH